MPENEKVLDRYGYLIRAQELVRPMGKITHVGKVTRMVDRLLKVDIPVSQFGETWGENAAEAHDKMDEIIRDWILQKGD